MRAKYIVGASVCSLVLMSGTAVAGSPAPISLTEAGADAQRRPFARWAPNYPIVNIRVSTRATRDEDTRPSFRYWVQTGFYGLVEDGPEPFWQGEYPLVPGVYYTAVQGDGPFQADLPWSSSVRFRVRARRGEWTGPTAQKRYIRFTRPRAALRGVTFSVYTPAVGCEGHSTFRLPRAVHVRQNGKFSAYFEGVWNISRQDTGNVRITGRVGRKFARGVIRVGNLFEGGCTTGPVRWSARLR